MDNIQRQLLEQISDLHEIPSGAYNIRANGKLDSRNTTEHIDIVTKTDVPGIDIIIKPGTKTIADKAFSCFPFIVCLSPRGKVGFDVNVGGCTGSPPRFPAHLWRAHARALHTYVPNLSLSLSLSLSLFLSPLIHTDERLFSAYMHDTTGRLRVRTLF